MGFIFLCASWPSVKWSEVAQLCLTVCGPMDCSLPGSSIHGIFKARILEWVAISFSRGCSQPKGIRHGSPTLQADSLLSEPPENNPVSWKKLSSLAQEYHGSCLSFLFHHGHLSNLPIQFLNCSSIIKIKPSSWGYSIGELTEIMYRKMLSKL